jgi:predicted permease
MFAVRFHQDEELSAKVVSVQTILSLVTIPLFIYFAQVYLG